MIAWERHIDARATTRTRCTAGLATPVDLRGRRAGAIRLRPGPRPRIRPPGNRAWRRLARLAQPPAVRAGRSASPSWSCSTTWPTPAAPGSGARRADGRGAARAAATTARYPVDQSAYVEPETGLSVRINSAGPAGYGCDTAIGREFSTCSGREPRAARVRLRTAAGGLWMDRADENQSSRLCPVTGSDDPTSSAGIVARTGRRTGSSSTPAARFTAASPACWAGADGAARADRARRLGPPCPRALDHTPPGDWTLGFRRAADGGRRRGDPRLLAGAWAGLPARRMEGQGGGILPRPTSIYLTPALAARRRPNSQKGRVGLGEGILFPPQSATFTASISFARRSSSGRITSGLAALRLSTTRARRVRGRPAAHRGPPSPPRSSSGPRPAAARPRRPWRGFAGPARPRRHSACGPGAASSHRRSGAPAAPHRGRRRRR